MLEKDRLLILPWSSTAGLPPEDVAGLTRVRRIQDVAGGVLLGFAGWAPQSWLRGTAIRVFEVPDASLLMSIHRPWGLMRMWQVYDSEEHNIGSFYRKAVFDGAGHPLSYFQDDQPGRPRKFLTRTRKEVGALEWTDDGSARLSFAASVDPFSRMNLLGVVLTLPSLPQK